MFVEKLSKKELVDFIKKIGFEPKQEMPDIKLNKDGDALVLISCEPTKLQKDFHIRFQNAFFLFSIPSILHNTI